MDNRLIENSTEYQFPIDKLQELIPVLFNYKATAKQGVGIEAQQLEKVLPLLVKRSSNAPLDVDYAKLSVVLLAIVKDMHERIQVLEKQNSKKKK